MKPLIIKFISAFYHYYHLIYSEILYYCDIIIIYKGCNKKPMNYKALRTKLLFALAFFGTILLLLIEYYHYENREKIYYEISSEKLFILIKTLRNFENRQTEIFEARTQRVQDNTELINALSQADIKKIYDLSIPDIKFFKKETPYLEHSHFYSLKGKKLLDNDHEKGEPHNILQESVLKEAMRTLKPTRGYISENNDIFFYSLIFPLYKEHKVIAFVEYGIKVDSIFKLTTKAGRYKYAIYLKSSNTKERKLGKLVATNSFMFENLHLTQDYIDKTANRNKIITYNQSYYLLHQYDIETTFQKNFAQVILAINTSNFVQESDTIFFTTLKFVVITFPLLLLLVYIILTKLINKLLEEEQSLFLQQKQIQVIMDNSDNLIVLLEDNEPVLLNNTLLSFTNHKDFSAFKKDGKNISQYFTPHKNTFTPENATTNTQWLKQLLLLDEDKRIVALKHEKFGLNYFSVKVTTPIDTDKNTKIIIFTNISSLYEKSMKDEYMAYHDNLTNIYNRQFFNQSIEKTLYLAQKENKISSLLMLDLDLFKQVNDTHGHQIGDDVLVLFTKTISQNIRENDIFARWGGEEFVLLLNGSNEEVAYKVAENLRKKIELTDFGQAGTITCSIGLSQIHANDSSDAWIARVDTALYKAKENGRNRVEIVT